MHILKLRHTPYSNAVVLLGSRQAAAASVIFLTLLNRAWVSLPIILINKINSIMVTCSFSQLYCEISALLAFFSVDRLLLLSLCNAGELEQVYRLSTGFPLKEWKNSQWLVIESLVSKVLSGLISVPILNCSMIDFMPAAYFVSQNDLSIFMSKQWVNVILVSDWKSSYSLWLNK